MAVVRVIELGDVPKKYLDITIQELNKKGWSNKFIIDSKMPLPQNAYDKYRQQYDAEKLLTMARDARVLFVTNADLYAQNRNFVFGLSKDRGPCIVSLARLDTTFYGNPMNFGVTTERLVKESIHEVGHMFGLTHCENVKCVMSFSQHFSDVDAKGLDYCKSCQVQLAAQGIRI